MPKQRRSPNWWFTLPGLLTAIAAVITAGTGLFVALHQPDTHVETVRPADKSGQPGPVGTCAPATATSPDTVILDTWNTDLVENGPTQPTKFSISRAYCITDIRSYHWNYGNGSPRGNISLHHDDGTVFGPWEVSTSRGSFDRENVAWQCNPNVTIPAGTYTVVDSDARTWSQNQRTRGMGMTIVKGHRMD